MIKLTKLYYPSSLIVSGNQLSKFTKLRILLLESKMESESNSTASACVTSNRQKVKSESDNSDNRKRRKGAASDCQDSTTPKKIKTEEIQNSLNPVPKKEKKKRSRKQGNATCGKDAKEAGGNQQPAAKGTQPVATTPPYTWFLAIPISDPSCHGGLRKAQEMILESNPVFLDTMVPVSKSHITLFLFNLDQDGIQDAKLNDLCETIEKAVGDWRYEVSGDNRDAITLKLDEVGHFSNRVIFVDPHWSALSPFPDLWRSLASRLFEDGFIPKHDTNFEKFKPHVTICKMSKVKRWKQMKRLPRSFPREFQTLIADIEYGEQNVTKLQLLSMNKPPAVDPVTRGSYYFCHKEFNLTDASSNILRPKPEAATLNSEHKMCCQMPLKVPSSKPHEEINDTNAPSPSSHPTRRPWSFTSGASTTSLLLIAGGGILLTLALARHFIRKF